MHITCILLTFFMVLQTSGIKQFLAAAQPDGSSFSRQSDSKEHSTEVTRYGTRTAPTKCHHSICSGKRSLPIDSQRRSSHGLGNKVSFPKMKFSRKYDSQGIPEDSGFVPVLDPYGKKPVGRRAPTQRLLQSTHKKKQPDRTVSRTTLPKKRSQAKLRVRNPPTEEFASDFREQQPEKQLPILKSSPQFEGQIKEELSARESVASENILGNGHFEIIRGGMFSDHEENEIAGSRRTSRGGQNEAYQNYYAMQNFQFPRYYMNRMPMTPYHPMFFPRAALSKR